MFCRKPDAWPPEPRPPDLLELLGPPTLKALSWALAAIIAAPLLLHLFAALLV